jgi:hypothetical protein
MGKNIFVNNLLINLYVSKILLENKLFKKGCI